MYDNTSLLQAYVCNVIATTLADKTEESFSTKLAKAAIGSVPKQVSVNTVPFTNMIVENTNLKQNPPSIQYEDGLELVNKWKSSIDTLPEVIETGLKVGDLIKK